MNITFDYLLNQSEYRNNPKLLVVLKEFRYYIEDFNYTYLDSADFTCFKCLDLVDMNYTFCESFYVSFCMACENATSNYHKALKTLNTDDFKKSIVSNLNVISKSLNVMNCMNYDIFKSFIDIENMFKKILYTLSKCKNYYEMMKKSEQEVLSTLKKIKEIFEKGKEFNNE